MGHRRRKSLRRGRSILQRGVRSDGVVVMAPLTDHNLGFLQTVEDLTVEQLIAQLAVEGLAVAVLPRTAGPDVKSLAPTCASHCRTILAIISAPLSDRICSGTPRVTMTSAIVSRTPW